MSQAFRELTNLCGGINPIEDDPNFGKPITPAHYPTGGGRAPGFTIGKGTLFQIPDARLQHAITRSWNWMYATAGLGVTVYPAAFIGGGGVTPDAPFETGAGFDFGVETPPNPGDDETNGDLSYPLNGTYDAYSQDGLYTRVGTYADIGVTGGIAEVFIAPILRVSLGRDTIFTFNENDDATGVDLLTGNLYWNDAVEMTLTWTLLGRGPGDVDRDIPVFPLQVIDGFPVDDGADGIMAPQTVTTLFGLLADHTTEADLVISDSVASTVETKNPKLRSLGFGDVSLVTVLDHGTIEITKWAHARANI